jgi:RNA polymerase sigma factor (sigma-70 family)
MLFWCVISNEKAFFRPATSQMIEDKLLIWKFKSGDTDALRRMYVKYKDHLLKLAVVLAGDVAIAEEAVQDVFVNLAQSAELIRISGNLKSFLSTCVANRIRNAKRDRSRHEIAATDSLDCIATDSGRPEQWAVISEELELLRNAMNQLEPEQREVIALYVEGQMRFRQIAQIQNVSINTVQGRYRYGLNKLRMLLNSEVHNESCR